MRVAMDVTSALVPKPAGVARVVERWWRALEAADDLQVTAWRKWRRSAVTPAGRNVRIWLPLLSRLGRGFDVAFMPDTRILPLPARRLVCTVHDLFALEDERFAPERFRRRKAAAYRRIAAAADLVVVPSQTTATALVEKTRIDSERVRVVPLGFDPDVFSPGEPESEVLRALGVRPPYLLCVGTLCFRKNQEAAVEVFERTQRRTEAELSLVLAGKTGWGGRAVVERVGRSPLRDRIVLTGHVGDRTLAALYRGAALLLHLSRSEGFGLPVIEALACGCPVIATPTGAVAETTACEATIVSSTEEAAEAALQLLARASEDDRRARARRVADITWEASGRALRAVLRRL